MGQPIKRSHEVKRGQAVKQKKRNLACEEGRNSEGKNHLTISKGGGDRPFPNQWGTVHLKGPAKFLGHTEGGKTKKNESH